MGLLPVARNTDYVSGVTPVKGNDLNDIQDQIIGSKRPPWWRHFYSAAPLTNSNFTFGTNPVNALAPPCWTSTSSGTILFPIYFDDGDRLIGFKYWSAGNGVVDVSGGVVLYSATFGAAPTTLAGWNDSNRAAAWGLVDVGAIAASPVFTPQMLAAGGTLYFSIPANGAALSIGSYSAQFDRL